MDLVPVPGGGFVRPGQVQGAHVDVEQAEEGENVLVVLAKRTSPEHLKVMK